MKILTYPSPILTQIAKSVKLPLSSSDLDLVKNMWQTVQGIGVGLAAPQVGASLQLFIVRLSQDKDLAKKLKESDFIVINPKITFYSQNKVSMIEGCLSFPSEYWDIVRSEIIQLEYDTIKNLKEVITKDAKPVYQKSKKLLAKGWLSRVIQHEYDHLSGKVFIKAGGKKLSKKDLANLEDAIID
ncbi:MAG: peptide deformylase [Candidatus Parcubacteria bacterium]|nr:peptide deformylase [Candidatus Paceibacterota bacterium]